MYTDVATEPLYIGGVLFRNNGNKFFHEKVPTSFVAQCGENGDGLIGIAEIHALAAALETWIK